MWELASYQEQTWDSLVAQRSRIRLWGRRLRRPLRFHPTVRKTPWRRAWQPTPKSHGQRSLAGYRPWGCKEPDVTGQLSMCLHAHTHTHTHHVSETCNYSDKIVTEEIFSLLVTCHSRSQCKNRRKKYPWGYCMWRSWCLPHWSKLQWINQYKMLLYWVKRGD